MHPPSEHLPQAQTQPEQQLQEGKEEMHRIQALCQTKCKYVVGRGEAAAGGTYLALQRSSLLVTKSIACI